MEPCAKKRRRSRRHQRGMTLIEIMVVILIMGLIMLLLFGTPLFAGFANAIMPLQIGAPDVLRLVTEQFAGIAVAALIVRARPAVERQEEAVAPPLVRVIRAERVFVPISGRPSLIFFRAPLEMDLATVTSYSFS